MAKSDVSKPGTGSNVSTTMAEKEASNRVSAIGETEMNRYLNTKKDMIYKKIIWELMNKDYLNQHQQNSRKKEKTTNTKKKRDGSSATIETEEEKERKKKQKLSAKINFDALDKLTDGEDEKRLPGGDDNNDNIDKYENGDGDNEGNGEDFIVDDDEDDDEEEEGVNGFEDEDYDYDAAAAYNFDDEDY